MDCSTRAFSSEACITNILRIRSYAKHAAWGAIDLAFRIHLADDLHLSIYNEKRFLSLVMTLQRPYLFVVLLASGIFAWALQAKQPDARVFGTAKVCWIGTHT
jgi:hypothetical protein